MLSPEETESKNSIWDILPQFADTSDVAYLEYLIDRHGRRECRDEVDFFLSEKARIAKFSVINMMSLIRERQVVKNSKLVNIAYDAGRVKYELINLDFLFGRFYDSDIRAERNELEGKLLALTKEKRDEETACWNEILALRKDLVLFMRDYKLSVLKKKALSFKSLENFVD